MYVCIYIHTHIHARTRVCKKITNIGRLEYLQN